MLVTRLVSSLEKVFLDQKPEDFSALSTVSMLKNQHLSCQLVTWDDGPNAPTRGLYSVKLTGPLAPFVRLRQVLVIPSLLPVYPGTKDTNYLRKEPGLYPDLLEPLHYDGRAEVIRGQARSIWVDIEPEGKIDAADYRLGVELWNGDDKVSENHLTVHVLDAFLPPQTLLVTQWFHCDCLAEYYHVPVFSERHWHIIENFAVTAVKNGINTLLTPVFTPPLDTEVGKERLTVQLVDVTRSGGVYTFGFEKLDRWIAMCDRIGVKNFEISHLYTQWGAQRAPKVMATVDGSMRRLFGWETDATGKEYRTFLRAFLSAFLSHMKERGDDRRCFFHISDEPDTACIAQYNAARNQVVDLLQGYTVMDALSHIEFYKSGAVTTPVVAVDAIEPFLKEKVSPLWAYYCCGQTEKVTNRFFAMPGARTRIAGMQFYKYNIAGFLQWGYNFYHSQGSADFLDPYVDSAGSYSMPSGDTYSVYPAADGTAKESIRLLQFREGLEDMRALQLCETYYTKEEILKELEAQGGEIRFDRCPRTSQEMLGLRAVADRMLARAISRKKTAGDEKEEPHRLLQSALAEEPPAHQTPPANSQKATEKRKGRTAFPDRIFSPEETKERRAAEAEAEDMMAQLAATLKSQKRKKETPKASAKMGKRKSAMKSEKTTPPSQTVKAAAVSAKSKTTAGRGTEKKKAPAPAAVTVTVMEKAKAKAEKKAKAVAKKESAAAKEDKGKDKPKVPTVNSKAAPTLPNKKEPAPTVKSQTVIEKSAKPATKSAPATEKIAQAKPKSPAAAEKAGKAESKSPTAAEKAAKAESKSPAAAEKAAKAESKSPAAAEKAGKAESKSPAAAEKAVKAETKSPAVAEKAGKAESKSPAAAEKAAKAESKSPAVAEKAAKAETKSPTAVEKAGKAEANTPEEAALAKAKAAMLAWAAAGGKDKDGKDGSAEKNSRTGKK